ncbi:MAG: hypothetical protein ACFFDB_00545 [Promethearchaeota archaeon]
MRFDIENWDEQKQVREFEKIQNPILLNVDVGKLSVLRFKVYKNIYSVGIGILNNSTIVSNIKIRFKDFKINLKNNILYWIPRSSDTLVRTYIKTKTRSNGREIKENMGGGYYNLKYTGDTSYSNAQIKFLINRSDDYDTQTDRLVITINKNNITEMIDLYLRDIESITGRIKIRIENITSERLETLYAKSFKIDDRISNFLNFRENLKKLIGIEDLNV